MTIYVLPDANTAAQFQTEILQFHLCSEVTSGGTVNVFPDQIWNGYAPQVNTIFNTIWEDYDKQPKTYNVNATFTAATSYHYSSVANTRTHHTLSLIFNAQAKHTETANANIAAWDPTKLEGLVAYYNAGTTIKSGNNILQWPDLGPSGFALNPSGTNPVWSANGLGSGPAVVWNGDTGGNSLVSDVASTFPDLSSLSLTVLFALNPVNDAEWIRIIGLQAAGDSNDYQTPTSIGLGQHSSDNGEVFYNGYVNQDEWAMGPNATCWILSGAVSNPWASYVNFVSTPTNAGEQAAAIGGANSIIGLGPAGVGAAGGTLNTGVLAIGAAIITNTQLSNTDISNLKTWMNTNWSTGF